MRIVHTLDELRGLPGDRDVNGFRARAAVRLEIPDVTTPALASAQDALNELQERSGSLAGALCMLLTLVYGVVLILQRHDSLLSLRAAGELLAVISLAFATGFAARFLSCIRTRWQFRRRCLALHRALTTSETG
jgi:hypothetical protein